MVVGSGDVASILPERDDLLFFASGVSNSQEERESEYKREHDLLLAQPTDRRLVYFGSLAVFYAKTRYAAHKRYMELEIMDLFPAYNIVRLGNIDWGTNPNTLINYLRAHPEADIRDEYRYVVGKDEFLHWIDLIPTWNCEMNVTGRRLKVQQIKEEYA